MGDLLVGLCTYMALQVNGTDACKTAIKQAYEQSSIKPYLDDEEKHLSKWGLGVYDGLPFKDELGAAAVLGYDAAKKDFKLPLTGSISLDYSNFNTYTFQLKWSF